MSFPLPSTSASTSASASLSSASADADDTSSDAVASGGTQRPSVATPAYAAFPEVTEEPLSSATARNALASAEERMTQLQVNSRLTSPRLYQLLTDRFERCAHLIDSTRDTIRDGMHLDTRRRLTRDVVHLQRSLLALEELLSKQPVAELETLFRCLSTVEVEVNQVVKALTQEGYDASGAAQLANIDRLIRNMDTAATPAAGQACRTQLLKYLQTLKSTAARPLPAPARFPLPTSGPVAAPPRPSTGLAASARPSLPTPSAPAATATATAPASASARPSTSLERRMPDASASASDPDGGSH